MDPLDRIKLQLRARAEEAVVPLTLTEQEYKKLFTAFNIAFDGHRLAPNRASGEIYFMHVFRQFMKLVRQMIYFKVKDVNSLATVLLHDVVEDAEKNKSTPFTMKSRIFFLIGDVVGYLVVCLSKDKEKETRGEYLERLSLSDEWRVLLLKPHDGSDNMITLTATPIQTQPGKVREIFEYYPKMKARAIRLITLECDSGRLHNKEGWLALTEAVYRNVRRNANKQKKRLETLGIHVV